MRNVGFLLRGTAIAFAVFAAWGGEVGKKAFAVDPFPLLGKAVPEQWYNGLGLPSPFVAYGSQGMSDPGQPKVTQDYIWSLADGGTTVWFGTGAGTKAIAAAQIDLLAGSTPTARENVSSGGIKTSADEYGLSQYPGIPAQLLQYEGDWRPPQIWQYDPAKNKLTNRTPNDPLIAKTLGLRSAGCANGVVILAGPTQYYTGVCMFAFDSTKGTYLGSKLFPQYSNIRSWVNTPAGLYTAVQNTVPAITRGSVLRWGGTKAAPFTFTTVGLLDNEGAYVAYHNDRLFVGTWQEDSVFSTALAQVRATQTGVPAPVVVPPSVSLYMSPAKLGKVGLLPVHAPFWTQVWKPSDYEPDPVLALGYSMGSMSSFGGSLYFGTLHYPNTGSTIFNMQYGYPAPRPTSTERAAGVPRNATERVLIIMKADGLGGTTPPTFELLYGNEKQPVFTPNPDPMVLGGTWAMVTNNYGHAGIYGNSGFGNSGNVYTWSSAVYNNKLYFGTFDSNTLGRINRVVDQIKTSQPVDPECGGDLWCFNDTTSAATAISKNGLGNPANHGIRNMVTTKSGLYFGTANSQNLLTVDPVLPKGGWEFRRMGP